MRYTYPGLIDFELAILPDSARTLHFTIHSQDDSINSAKLVNNFEFTASNGVEICSRGYIQIGSGDGIFLHGSSKPSTKTASKTYGYAADAQEYLAKFAAAFKELAESKGIFQEGAEPASTQLSLWDD